MPNREVNLTKRVRTAQGLRFCPVVLSVNGRVKPDWVIVNGMQRAIPGSKVDPEKKPTTTATIGDTPSK